MSSSRQKQQHQQHGNDSKNGTNNDGESPDDDDGENDDQYYYHVLVEFAFKHTDFQLSELESVLDMYGIALIRDEKTNDDDDDDNKNINNNNNNNNTSSTTTKTIARIIHLPNWKKEDQQQQRTRPFVILAFPIYDDAENHSILINQIGSIIVERCTLVRSCIELWGTGTNIDECVRSTKRWLSRKYNQRLYQKHLVNGDGGNSNSNSDDDNEDNNNNNNNNDNSWKLTIHTLGSSYDRQEQELMRNQFCPSVINPPGPVQMKNPTTELVYIQEVELDKNGGAIYPRQTKRKKKEEERGDGGGHDDDDDDDDEEEGTEERPPLACYFGRALNGVRQTKGRAQLHHYTLKKRSYLGPTSMDAELALIMSNLGQVTASSFVLDPFVGTGSILLSCALRGAAYCVGTDIDIRVLRGKSQHENVLSNFRQYNLPRPELIRSDNAIYHRHFRRHKPLYDAIVCDPPYGIRAGARKSGSRFKNPRPVLDEHRHDHIAQTKPYPVSDVMADLLDVAARTLVMNGRLVYIIPSFSDFNPESDLPRHECLRVVHTCYQPLGTDLGRRVVAMKKVKEYDESKRSSYLAATWKNGAESAEKCANIRDKLLEAAKLKPGYEEKSRHRKQKRKQHREEKKRAKLQKAAAAADSTSEASTTKD